MLGRFLIRSTFLLLSILFALVPVATFAQSQTQYFTVRELDYDVDTQLYVNPGNTVDITCSGSIWSGVWLTGTNGPEGWSNITFNSKYPLPNNHPYMMLGKLNGNYFPVGRGTTFQHSNSPSRLYLRINDDTPGNGSGSFVCAVQIH